MISLKGLEITVIYGKKGNCKSLYQTMIVDYLIRQYYRTEKRYPELPKRKVYINQKLSKAFEEKELGKHLEYWTHPEQLYKVRDSDIIWDEIGKDLPAGSYAETPKEMKQIFSHLRKRGNRLIANTQVYEDIDISFRRQVDKAYQLKKWIGSRDISATLPKPDFIWGVFFVRQFDPMFLEHEWDPNEREKQPDLNLIPQFHFIRRKYIEMYNTTEELPPYQATSLKEQVMVCREGDKCQDKEKDGRPCTWVKHKPV